MTIKRFLILSLIVIVGCAAARADQAVNAGMLMEQLGRSLAGADNAADSLKIYQNMYDLSDRSRQRDLGWKIYALDERVEDPAAQGDMLCQLAVLYLKNDSVLTHLHNLAQLLPPGVVRDATSLFVTVQQVTGRVSFQDEDHRMAHIKKLLVNETSAAASDKGTKEKAHENLYEQIERLYTLVLYLGSTTTGSMYQEYLDKLSEKIDALPQNVYQMRNIFYTTSANYYTNNDMHDKAVVADRKLLDVITGLEKKYADAGRKYRNYNTFKYLCYRRMLSNYKALTPEEVEDIYARAHMLVATDSEVRDDYQLNQRIDIYYLMSKGKYRQAEPLILRWLDKNTTKPMIRRQMLSLLKEAAEQTGDESTLLMALKEYNEVLNEYSKLQGMEAYREMQIRYDVSELRAQTAEAELESAQTKVEFNHKVILVTLTAAFILMIVLLMIVHRYSSLKRRAQSLADEMVIVKDENKRLSATRDRLKTEVKGLRIRTAGLPDEQPEPARSEPSPYAPPLD